MKTQNKVQLIAYLGQDPVIRTTPNGNTIANFRAATHDYYKDADGNAHNITTWHDIVAWDKIAASVSGNYIKGSHVLIEGKICHRTWEDRNGHVRYVTEIKASTLINLDR